MNRDELKELIRESISEVVDEGHRAKKEGYDVKQEYAELIEARDAYKRKMYTFIANLKHRSPEDYDMYKSEFHKFTININDLGDEMQYTFR